MLHSEHGLLRPPLFIRANRKRFARRPQRCEPFV
jgi:hypothetical protein